MLSNATVVAEDRAQADAQMFYRRGGRDRLLRGGGHRGFGWPGWL